MHVSCPGPPSAPGSALSPPGQGRRSHLRNRLGHGCEACNTEPGTGTSVTTGKRVTAGLTAATGPVVPSDPGVALRGAKVSVSAFMVGRTTFETAPTAGSAVGPASVEAPAG